MVWRIQYETGVKDLVVFSLDLDLVPLSSGLDIDLALIPLRFGLDLIMANPGVHSNTHTAFLYRMQKAVRYNLSGI